MSNLSQREIDLILEICQQVDLLVTQDPGTMDLEVLETSRLRMNDFIWKKKYREAENTASAILLMHAGIKAEQYLLNEAWDQ